MHGGVEQPGILDRVDVELVYERQDVFQGETRSLAQAVQQVGVPLSGAGGKRTDLVPPRVAVRSLVDRADGCFLLAHTVSLQLAGRGRARRRGSAARSSP